MFCIHCGGQIADGSKFCSLCGKPQTIPAPAPEPVISEPAPMAEPIPAAIPVEEIPAVEIPAPVYIAPEQPQAAGPVCVSCGNPLKPGAKFCVHCGATQIAAAPVQPPKKKKKGLVIAIVCVILAAVLGVCGWFGYQHLPKYLDYQKAQKLVDEGNLEEALEIFTQLEDFKDSQSLAEDTNNRILYRDGVEALNDGQVYVARDLLSGLEYSDSAEKLQDTQALIDAYEAAVNLLDQGKLDDAEAAFQDISYVEDSQYHMDFTIPFRKTLDLLDMVDSRDPEALEIIGWSGEETAGYIQAYETVIADLEALNDEQTAFSRSSAYLGLSLLYLELGEADKAQDTSENISELEHLTQYENRKEDFESLNKYLSAWEEALGIRAQCLSTGNYNCAEELNALKASMEANGCPDETLSDLANGYTSIVENQQKLLNEQGSPTELAPWLELEIRRYEILDQLNEEYGFLNGNTSLKESSIGQVPFTTAWLAVEQSFQTQYSSVSMITSAEDGFFVTYTNNTEYEFTLELTLSFLDQDLNVLDEVSNTFTLKPGETTQIPLEFPDHEYWTARYAIKEVQLPESI